ncbi:MAG: SulP family inorganic anion transporter [Candidatus Obscuribacterales bacterium]|nr:SulP family inorganic anion transporter [Candidatus Obscuribacterales bacterium]
MNSSARSDSYFSDFVASIVVFLVALPLCMGIAIASGVPASVGIMTGVVGGLIVGTLSGSPLQVSGPAAGLVVMVTELARQHSIETLGLVVVMAGVMQLVSGAFGLGQWFRAVPPAVIHGMLSGIGLLLIGSQFQVMADEKPSASGLENLIAIPNTLGQLLSSTWSEQHIALVVGFGTIAGVLLWDKLIPKRFKKIPGSLIAIVAATLICELLALPIKRVEIPDNILQSFHLPSFSALQNFKAFELLLDALALAFIASTETMLTAAAIDKMTPTLRTDYDKELRAQGVGNVCAGFLGLLPITGVIARSGVNVAAGAKSRLSSVLHGVWLVAFVLLLGNVLRMVPIASLAALLVFTGYKLFLSKEAQELRKYSLAEFGIYFVTLGSIVFFDLLTGVIVGVVLSVAKLLYIFSHLTVRMQVDPNNQASKIMFLGGAATFLSLPKLAQFLDAIPDGTELHVNLNRLEYVDHACFDLLRSWEQRQSATGGQLIIDWGTLSAKSKREQDTTPTTPGIAGRSS